MLIVIYTRICIYYLQKFDELNEKCASLNEHVELLSVNTNYFKNQSRRLPNANSLETIPLLDSSKDSKKNVSYRFASYGSETGMKSMNTDMQGLKASKELFSKKTSVKNNRTLLGIPAFIGGKLKYISSMKETMNFHRRPLSFTSNSLTRSRDSEYEKSESNVEKNYIPKYLCESKNSRCNEIPDYITKEFRSKEESIQISELKPKVSSVMKSDYDSDYYAISELIHENNHVIKSDYEEISDKKYEESQILESTYEDSSIEKSDITKSAAKDSYEDFTSYVFRRSLLGIDSEHKNWIDMNAKNIINIEDKQYDFNTGKIINVFIN